MLGCQRGCRFQFCVMCVKHSARDHVGRTATMKAEWEELACMRSPGSAGEVVDKISNNPAERRNRLTNTSMPMPMRRPVPGFLN